MQLDLIVENARILTGDSYRPTATTLGVWNGVFVGVDERIEGMDAAVRVDAGGQVITPGFNDAHAHSVWFGQSLLELDLEGLQGADAVCAAIEERDRGSRGVRPGSEAGEAGRRGPASCGRRFHPAPRFRPYSAKVYIPCTSGDPPPP